MKLIHARLAAVAATAALLSACGGGSEVVDTPMTSNTVPASALASPTAYTEFAKSLQPSATALPIDVNGIVPPTTETGSPVSL